MPLGSARQHFLDATAPAEDPPSSVPHDLIAHLAAILADPPTTAKAIADLNEASKAYRAASSKARAEQDAAAIAASQLAADRQKHADKVAADESAFDKRVAARELELSAREKRTSELLRAAEADVAAAAEMKAKLQRKLQLIEAA